METLAIEVNKNLKRGDRCTLKGIVQGGRNRYDHMESAMIRKNLLDLLSLDLIEKKIGPFVQ